MRRIDEPTDSVVCAGSLQCGSFRGPLPRIELAELASAVAPTSGASGWLRLRSQGKRWSYACVVSDELLISAAVVDLGYAASAFAFALDLRERRVLFDESFMGPPGASVARDDGPGQRTASFQGLGAALMVGDRGLRIDARSKAGPSILAELKFDQPTASPISAIGEPGPGAASTTEKRICRAQGTLLADNRRYALAGVAGLDHTAGLLPRQTLWRWAMGLGETLDGVPVAFNLVEGFMGEAECALWWSDELIGLAEGLIAVDVRAPWAVSSVSTRCGSLDLSFRPGVVHREQKNLGLVRSRFFQIGGAFEGTLRHAGQEHRFSAVGVTEHQEVRW